MRKKVSENSFEGQKIYVGNDCHKKSWKVTILTESLEHRSYSQNPDSELLASYLKRHFPGGDYKAVYEAGFSGFGACRRLRDLGVSCEVVHAADVPTTQKEKGQKTDRSDSRKLARMLRSREMSYVDVPDRQLEADRALVRQRFRISREVARTKHRIKSLLMQFGIQLPDNLTGNRSRHWSKAYTRWLKELSIDQPSLRQTLDNYLSLGEVQRMELLKLNRQLGELSQQPRYQKNFKLLLTVPGIGPVTAMHILVQLGDVRRFRRLDQLNNYIGLVPSMHNSGDKIRTGKLLKRGRRELKIMLIEASWQAIRRDPALLLKFNELTKAMAKNKAIIRIARKLLSRVRSILINGHGYEIGIVV